jgi:hypothetical protein
MEIAGYCIGFHRIAWQSIARDFNLNPHGERRHVKRSRVGCDAFIPGADK